MDRIEKSMDALCDSFDKTSDLERKSDYLSMIERMADVHVKVARQETEALKTQLDHDEAMEKIEALAEAESKKAEFEESKEIREDRKLALEEAKLDFEKDKAEAELTAEEKAEIAKTVVAVAGTVSGAIVGVLGLKNSEKIFAGLKEWDNKDVIPMSTGWDFFKKNKKV